MRRVKAIYDGKQIRLLEPISIPPDTPVEVIVPENVEEDPWSELGEDALDLGITDLAEEHDHYLYGIPKRKRKE
jgi:hypothetical protein